MVETEKYDHIPLVYHYSVPLRNIQPFSQTVQMMELCYENFSLWYIDWVFFSCYIWAWSDYLYSVISLISGNFFGNCLNVKELLKNRCNFWNLSDHNRIWTQTYWAGKWALNHQAKLAKWLSCFVKMYLHSASILCFYVTKKFGVNIFVCKLPRCEFNFCCSYLKFWNHTCFKQLNLDNQAITECRFTLNAFDMIKHTVNARLHLNKTTEPFG